MNKQNRNYKTEESAEIKKFVFILLMVIALIAAVFGISKIIIKDEAKDLEYTSGEVSTNSAIIGTMLNRPEKEYYVLLYDTTSKNASAYVTYANYYKTKDNALKVYYLDLTSAFNKDYYVTENSNPNAKKIKDLKVKDGTLIKVKNGAIKEYTEGIENIAKKLK